MYSNIDTDTGIAAIQDFRHTNKNILPKDFPTNIFLQILELAIRNNIFSFADTYWLQLSRTAMGTPVACNYATVTYGYFKNTEILPSFHSNLLYYKRYIDDIFGIWLPPSKQTNFLDLHLQLHNGRITTLTYVPKRPKSISLHPPSISAPFHLLQRIDKR